MREAFWLGMQVVIFGAVFLTFLVIKPELLLVGVGLAILISFLWLKKCFRRVGAEIPSQGVITRFGKPIDAVPAGLCFIFWPFENIREFPTGEYSMRFRIAEGLYSKEEEGLSSQPMEVEVNLYLRFPRIDREYTFLVWEEEVRPGEEGKIYRERKRVEERVRGKELLMRAYYRLPFDPKTMKTEQLGKFVEGAVMGAVRHVMSAKNYIQCRQEQPEIAKKIKEYLLSEEGNPFFEIGIPKECLDIEIVKVKFLEEMERKFIEPEMRKKEAEAAEAEKKRIETLAEAEKKRIELVTKAYVEQGVSPEIAALLAGEVTGKGMSIEQLRDLAIVKSLLGKNLAKEK